MNKIFSIFLIIISCFISQWTFSQKVTFKGIVEDYSIKQGDKVYYRENENPYTPNKFIIVNKNKTYSFTYDFFQFIKKRIRSLSFSKTVKKTECEHTINVLALQDELPQMFKNFIIETDLFLNFNCEISESSSAKERGEEAFLGDYLLTCGDTVKQVSFEDILYRYQSKYTIKNDLYNEEFGRWGFNMNDKVLTIYSWYVFNNPIGLKKVHRKKYQFKVALKNGQFDFTNLGEKQDIKLEKASTQKLIINNGNFIAEPLIIKKIVTTLPSDLNFKQVYQNSKWYGHSDVMTPDGERFLESNLVFMSNTSMEDKHLILQEIIKKEFEAAKNDSFAIYKMLDSASGNDNTWILMAVENSTFNVDRTKPLSYIKYAGSTNNVYFEVQIRISEKVLNKEFIDKWKPILLNSKLVDTYADE